MLRFRYEALPGRVVFGARTPAQDLRKPENRNRAAAIQASGRTTSVNTGGVR